MPTDSRQYSRLDILGGYSTYGASVASSAAEVFSASRARNWTRTYKGRKAAMVALLEKGFLPTTPYVDDWQTVLNSSVLRFTGRLYSDPRSTFDWSFIPSTPRTSVGTSDSTLESYVALADAALQSKISGHGTNLYVSALEAKETVGMIAGTAARLVKAYRHVRHCNFKAAARALNLEQTPKRVGKHRSVESNWLEYRYGWRLVVMDAESLMKTLYDQLTTRPPLLRVTTVKGGEVDGGWRVWKDLQLSLPSYGMTITYNHYRRIIMRYKVTAGYVYELQSVPLATGQAFGLLNPLTVAWEIIPYSFVLDWFVNVSSVLEGLTAFQGKRWRDGWLCKSIESETRYVWNGFRKGSIYSLDPLPARWESGPVIERRFARSQRSFTPSSIRLDVDLGVSRVADAVGMLKQIAQKHRAT